MYEIYECLRCNNIFDMTDNGRKDFTKNGGCIIKCPECGCLGLDRFYKSKQCAGCINLETGRFLSCIDCTFEPSKYNCDAYRQDYSNYQVITVNFNETIWSK